MSFYDKVAKIRDGVLCNPEYSKPIKEINERINGDMVKRGTEIYRPDLDEYLNVL